MHYGSVTLLHLIGNAHAHWGAGKCRVRGVLTKGNLTVLPSPAWSFLHNTNITHPTSQEGHKDHQGQQPPEPLPVHPTIIQKARSVQLHQSGDRETEKQLLSQGHQTVKQPSLTLSGCCQHTDSTLATLIMDKLM
jgi:hypothetical protein